MQPKTPYRLTFTATQKKIFRGIDILLAISGIIASVVVLFGLTYGTVYYGNRSEGDIGVLITLMIIVGVQVWLALTAFTLMPPAGREDATTKSSSRPFWYQCSLLSVLIIWVMTFPWIFTHLGDESPLLIGLFAVPLMLALGMLFGALAWLFVTVPFNLLFRSLFALVVKRDTSVVPALTLSLMLISMGAIIVTMPSAVEIGHTGQAGYPAMLAAMAGLPGDYRVENEITLFIGRSAAAVAAITIVLWLFLSQKSKEPVQRHIDSAFTEKIESKPTKKPKKLS